MCLGHDPGLKGQVGCKGMKHHRFFCLLRYSLVYLQFALNQVRMKALAGIIIMADGHSVCHSHIFCDDGG